MLCGALQTLNEEACEDVMVEAASELKEIPHPSSTALVDIPVCEPGERLENFFADCTYIRIDDSDLSSS